MFLKKINLIVTHTIKQIKMDMCSWSENDKIIDLLEILVSSKKIIIFEFKNHIQNSTKSLSSFEKKIDVVFG